MAKIKDPIKVKRGKTSRAAGSEFERRTRADLEFKEWTVDKWTNNVEFKNECDILDSQLVGKLIPAKHVFNGRGRPMAIGTGFPDFIAIRNLHVGEIGKSIIINKDNKPVIEFKTSQITEVIGVECKVNGKLKKEEKEKCRWLLENRIFSRILIASKSKEGRKVVVKYEDFLEKYG